MELAALIANLQVNTVYVVMVIMIVGAITTGFGFAILGCKFFDSCVRQPELIPVLQTKLFIIAGLLDAISMIGVGVALLYSFNNPLVQAILDAAAQSAGH